MSEKKPEPTTQEQINELEIKYSQLCGSAGDLTYRQDCVTKQIEELYIEMRNINRRGAELQKQLAKERHEEAAKLKVSETATKEEVTA